MSLVDYFCPLREHYEERELCEVNKLCTSFVNIKSAPFILLELKAGYCSLLVTMSLSTDDRRRAHLHSVIDRFTCPCEAFLFWMMGIIRMPSIIRIRGYSGYWTDSNMIEPLRMFRAQLLKIKENKKIIRNPSSVQKKRNTLLLNSLSPPSLQASRQ